MSSSNDVDSLAYKSIFSASVASTCPTVDSLELSRLSTRTNSSVRTQGFQDVIKTVQTLKLDIYPHSVIERTEFVDEGETFWVERCTVRGKIMAVKRLKLANNSREEFIRRISSLVLELRIMHHAPLRNHSNILSLIGYGWSLAGTATLPYILVDYCSGGNLRQYLNSHKLAASHVDGTITQDETTLRKEKLLADVAAGIHALHAANIIHGDIKLENVLVSVPNEQDRFPIAKICDFGHSIVKGPNEDSQMSNKYRGTQSYNAPEVMTQDVKPLDQTGMKRCDIWAFGILTWETLLDGASYKEQVTYKRGLTLGEGSDKSDDDLRFRLIFWVALRSADKVDNVGQRKVFKDVLRHTLQHRAHFRSDRLSSLQIMKDWRVGESTDPGAQLAIRSGVAAWSYEIFRQNIDHAISWAHKSLIMEDFRTIYEHESASIMAKSSAAWQLGLCYSIGFGIPTDHSKADMYIEQAIKLGNGIARNFGPLIVQQGLNGAVEHCREAAQHMLSIETTPPGTMFDQGPTTTPAQDAIDVQMRRHDALLLEDAILSGDSKTVEVSFVKQVPWTQLPCGESPLVLAMRRQDPRVALALLTRVEYPFRPDKSGRNMFHWLFMIDDDVLGFSNRILERSGPELLDAVNVPATQEMGIYPQWPLQLLGTPLMHAIATGSINTVVALLDLGADPLAVGYTANSIRWTAFHVAVKYHNPDVFVLLTKTKKMGTMDLPVDLARALCMATIPERMAMYGRDMIKNAERIVQLVIPAAKESGPSLPSKTEYFASQGRTNWRLEALKMSLDVGDDAMTEAIIACNESLAREEYIPTYDDSMAFRNPIHDAVLLASQRTDPDVLTSMKLILKRDPIGLSRVDSQGRTCLHLAASGLNLYVVSFLIEQDPSLLHMKDHQGALPLHYGESAAIVEQLLELGASIDALDGHGLSPLLYATNKGLIDVVNCLCRNKAVIDAPDGSPWGPLHMAIHSSKPEIATALIRFGARVNRKNEAGDTPLHVAARRSSHLEIKLLLDHNADPSIQNNMGQLALHVAAEWNNLAAIELLPKSLLTHVSVSSRPTKEHMQTVRDMSASSEKSERYSEVREYHKSLCLSVGPALHNLYETRRSSLPSVFNPAVHATGDGSSTRDDPPFALQPYQMAQAPPTNLITQESGPRYVQDSTARAGILSAERSALWKRRRHCEAR